MAGGKLWRLKYRLGGKERLLSIGPYPGVGLADARATAAEAKKMLREGKDPSLEKRRQRLMVATDGGDTFEAIAREWHAINKRQWVSRRRKDAQ